ncbi:RasGEF [Sparganum proliferum]
MLTMDFDEDNVAFFDHKPPDPRPSSRRKVSLWPNNYSASRIKPRRVSLEKGKKRSTSHHPFSPTRLPLSERLTSDDEVCSDSGTFHLLNHRSSMTLSAIQQSIDDDQVDSGNSDFFHNNTLESVRNPTGQFLRWPRTPRLPGRTRFRRPVSPTCIHRSDDTLDVCEKPMDLLQIRPIVLAQQITLIELECFKAINAEEFLSFKWNGREKAKYAPSICASTRWFNRIIFWIHQEILSLIPLPKRVEMLAYFIRTAKKLVELNNLCSAKAFVSALQVECIHRLKETWAGLSTRDRNTFKKLSEIFRPDNNFENLRNMHDNAHLPCIPYLGLYLNDLTYIDVACPHTVSHGQSVFTNQVRVDRINNVLRIIADFQTSTYPFERNEVIASFLESQSYLEELQRFIEDANYKASLRLEPPQPPSTTPSVCAMDSSTHSVSLPLSGGSMPPCMPSALGTTTSATASSSSSCEPSDVDGLFQPGHHHNISSGVNLAFVNTAATQKPTRPRIGKPFMKSHKRMSSWTAGICDLTKGNSPASRKTSFGTAFSRTIHNEPKPAMTLKSWKNFDADLPDLPPMAPNKTIAPAPSKPVDTFTPSTLAGPNTEKIPSHTQPISRDERITNDDAPRLPGINEICKPSTPFKKRVKSSVAFDILGTVETENELGALASQPPTTVSSHRKPSNAESITLSQFFPDDTDHFHISSMTADFREMKVHPPDSYSQPAVPKSSKLGVAAEDMPSYNRTASVPNQKTALMNASATPWSSSYSSPNSCSPLQFAFGDLGPPVPELTGAQSSPATLSSTICHRDFLSLLAHSALKLVSQHPCHQGMSPKIAAEGPVLCMINKAEIDLPPSIHKRQQQQVEPLTPRCRATFEIDGDAFSSLSSLPPSSISSTRSSFSSATISSAIENRLIPSSGAETNDVESSGRLSSLATALRHKLSYVSNRGHIAANLVMGAVSAVARRRSAILNSSTVSEADTLPSPLKLKPRWAVLVAWSPSETEHCPSALSDRLHHAPPLSLVLFRPRRCHSKHLRMLTTPSPVPKSVPSGTQRTVSFLGSPNSSVGGDVSSTFSNPEDFKTAATLFSTSRCRLYASVSIYRPRKWGCQLSAPASPLPVSLDSPSLQLLDNQSRQTVHLSYFNLQDQLAPSSPRPSSAVDRGSPRFSAPFLPLLRRFSLSLPLHRPRRQRRRGVIPQQQQSQANVPCQYEQLEQQQQQCLPGLSDFLLTSDSRALFATFPFTFRNWANPG